MKNKKKLKFQSLRLSKLVIALALLLVPTAIQSKECLSTLKYETSAIYNMVTACFQHLNMNSMQMFGLPIIPIHGLNQCACISTKIRLNFECAEDYMVLVNADQAAPVLGEYSKQCIIEGAMGEAARKAYLKADTEEARKAFAEADNKTQETTPPKKEKISTSNKKPLTWDDLINKNGK